MVSISQKKTMASFLPSDLPDTHLIVRTKESIVAYDGPIKSGDDGVTTTLKLASHFEAVKDLRNCPVFSPEGSIVCFVFERKPISLCSTATGEEVRSIGITDAEYVEFSPKGSYLVTWSRPTKGSATASTEGGNMRVWNTSNGELVTSFSQKAYRTQAIQWTANEEYCFRMVSNEVQVFTDGNLAVPTDKVYHKGLTQFHVTPTTAPYITIAVFNPEAGGKPARVTLYRYNPSTTLSDTLTTRVEGPVSSRTIFAASEAKLSWNATGSALLVHAHADTDASSYYGATGLFLLQAHSDAAIKVEQSKDGPVHDVQWSPEGDKFVIAAGTMPCHCTLMDSAGVPLYQYGAAHRNTISWSPHGRFLCLAGFGNLAGEMDFYDTLRGKKIGSASSHCSTYFAWSPDSRYFLTASLAPRMNVDNNLKVFKYNGLGPIITVPFDRAYDVRWRPAPVGVYPNRGPSPKRGSDGSEAAAPAAKPAIAAAQPYRPPGSTGAFAKLLSRETAPVGKIKPGASAAAPASAPVGASAGKFVPSTQRNRVIPGMAPPGSAPAAVKKPAAPASTSGAAPAPKKTPAPAPGPKAAPAPATAPKAAPAVADTAENREKRAKNINKKLKAIEEIKAKQAAGQALEPEQVQKLSTEAELVAELKSLNL